MAKDDYGGIVVSGVQDMGRVQDIVVFRNRRCFAEDYSVFDGRGVTGKVANALRPLEEGVYEFKPRTSSFSDGATGVDLAAQSVPDADAYSARGAGDEQLRVLCGALGGPDCVCVSGLYMIVTSLRSVLEHMVGCLR